MEVYDLITRTYEVNGFKVITNLELKLETTKEFSKLYNDELEFYLHHNGKEVVLKTKNSDSWDNLEGIASFKDEIKGGNSEYTFEYDRDKKTFKIRYEKKENPGPAPCCGCKL